MSLLLRTGRARLALLLGLGSALALIAPAACLFPDYSFDQPETTGGSGASGSTSTSTSTSSGSSSSGTNPENCTNGVDDDNDGGIDCADVKCTDHVCIPEVPTGWTGYFALYAGAPAADPGCPAQFPSTSNPAFLGNSGINAPAAVCSCTCGAATGQTCAALDTITISTGDAQCGQATTCTGDLNPPNGWNGSCFGPNYFQGGQTTCGQNTVDCTTPNTGVACMQSVTASALAATGGSCTPNPVAVMKPDVTWAQLGHACGDSGMLGQGCNIGQSCLPRPTAPFETGVCISMEGDNSCPAGAFTQKHVFYSGVMDTRDCTDNCSCGGASGGTCPTTIRVYSDTQQNTCNTQIAAFPAGTCMNVAGNPNVSGRRADAPGAPTGGTCSGSGGTPQGTVTPTNPTTFCCIP